MLILGIKTGGHDTAAAVVKNGEVVAASAEERFDRIKHSKNFPKQSIRFCLDYSGVSIKDVDVIAIPFQYWQGFLDLVFRFSVQYFPSSLKASCTLLSYLVHKKIDGDRFIRNKLRYRGTIIYLDHHDCHAASAFFPSQFYSSGILTIDGRGEQATTRLYRGINNTLQRISTLAVYPHSLGYFYTAITSYLGFEHNSGEGKMMGLSAYGDWKVFNKYVDIVKLLPGGKFELDLSFFDFYLGPGRTVSKKFESLFGPPRSPGEQILQRHKDVAAFAQYVLERSILHIARFTKQATGEKYLCLAGGVALNSITNGLILDNLDLEDIFIQPAAMDDGAALGAALLAYYTSEGALERRDHKGAIVYIGPSYSEEEIEPILKRNKLKYKMVSDIERVVVREIAKGKIIAWFQGRSEFGPRALGNRSILADPRDPTMKNKLNKVKFRESFRPFAPAVTGEDASIYFDTNLSSPYMLITRNVRPKYRKLLPAVTHVDGTARIQTVSRDQNPRFWKLLKEFEKVTGLPVLLNTSFNIKREPIVSSPQDAVKSFLSTGIDILAIGNFIVRK